MGLVGTWIKAKKWTVSVITTCINQGDRFDRSHNTQGIKRKWGNSEGWDFGKCARVSIFLVPIVEDNSAVMRYCLKGVSLCDYVKNRALYILDTLVLSSLPIIGVKNEGMRWQPRSALRPWDLNLLSVGTGEFYWFPEFYWWNDMITDSWQLFSIIRLD